MRLKGGKILIDLSSYDVSQDIDYQLTDEEIKTILDKGLSVRILSGVYCVVDLIPQKIADGLIEYHHLFLISGGVQVEFSVNLNLPNKLLNFTEV